MIADVLDSHVRAKHTFEKPHACPHCDFRSVQKGNIRVHIFRRHQNCCILRSANKNTGKTAQSRQAGISTKSPELKIVNFGLKVPSIYLCCRNLCALLQKQVSFDESVFCYFRSIGASRTRHAHVRKYACLSTLRLPFCPKN